MRMPWSGRAPLVGLDIGSSLIRAVVLSHARSTWRLVSASEAPTPENGMRDGVCVDSVGVAEVVRTLAFTPRRRRARIATALSGHAVIVKRVSLPLMETRELADAMSFEAEQYIPFDLSEVQIAYQVLSKSAPGPTPTMEVLLVAAKRDRVEDRASVVSQAGGDPAVVDVEAFALANAYAVNYPERDEPLVALVHAGRGTTVVCLLEHGRPAFTRDIALGGQAYTDALARDGGLDESAAEQLKGRIGRARAGDEAVSTLRDVTSQLVGEIRKSVDFYRATAPVAQLTRVMVSGGASRTAGLCAQMTSDLGVPAELFDPFRRIAQADREARVAEADAPAFAVAVGLALRQERAA